MNHSITSHPCDNVSLAQLTELAQSGNSEAQYILGRLYNDERIDGSEGNDSNLLIVFYVQIMPDDFVMQLHRF